MKDRELTPNTKWIVCMWDIRGESPTETAKLMKRSIEQILGIIKECKEDGYYEKVRRHIEYFDITNARKALMGFASAIAENGGGEFIEQR